METVVKYKMRDILITAKINPDMDGVACSYAYSELYGGIPVFFGKLLPEPEFVLNKLKIKPRMNIENWNGKFVIVDSSSLQGMPKIIKPENVVEVIDHRIVDINEVKRIFPNAKIQIELVGAAATLLAERYRNRAPSKEVATMIYCAIISNTLHLQTKNTTSRDVKILKKMLKISPEASKIAKEMLIYKTKEIERNLKENIVNDFKCWNIKSIKIGIAQLELYNANNILKRRKEIIMILKNLKRELNLDYCLLNMPDIKENINYFIFADEKSKEFLSKYIKFDEKDKLGVLDNVILRKEIKKILLENIANI